MGKIPNRNVEKSIMTPEERDKLTTIDIRQKMVEKSIDDVVKGLESLSVIENALFDCKTFRNGFTDNVRQLINRELDSKHVIEDLEVKINKEVGIIFDKQHVREELYKKINRVIDTRIKDMQVTAVLKLVGWVTGSSVLTAVALWKMFDA